MKKIVQRILKYPTIARRVLPVALKVHNRAYQIAGMLSSRLEPDGLHPKHRIMQYHKWFMERLQPHWHVLDIGCGNGALAYDLKSACASVFAIDINMKNIERAKKQFAREGVTYICGDGIKYNFERKFDAIVLSNVLEHIENRVEFLHRIYAVQDQQNPPVFLLRAPMITRDWISLYKKEMGVEWRLDKSHFTEYTLGQLEAELDQASLQIERYSIQFGEFWGIVKKVNSSSS